MRSTQRALAQDTGSVLALPPPRARPDRHHAHSGGGGGGGGGGGARIRVTGATEAQVPRAAPRRWRCSGAGMA